MFGTKVLESTTTTGTGSYVLGGAPEGCVSFVNAPFIGDGKPAFYFCTNVGGSIWEAGWGVVTDGSPDSLTRNVIRSSSGGSAINWTAGTKYIYSVPDGEVIASLMRTHRGTTRPAWLQNGGLWIDSDTDTLYWYDGTGDREIGVVSGGEFIPYSNGESLARESFRAHKNGTNQTSVATGVATKVTFATESWDVGSIYDATNSKIQPTRACKMRVTFQAVISAGIVDQARIIGYLYKNGSQAARDVGTISGTPTVVSARASDIIEFNGTTDYVEAYVIVEGAGDKTISGEAIGTYLCGEVI